MKTKNLFLVFLISFFSYSCSFILANPCLGNQREWSGDGFDCAKALAVDSDSNYISPVKAMALELRLIFVRLSMTKNGNQLWVSRYNGQENGWDRAFVLFLIIKAISLWLDTSWRTHTQLNYCIIKYDPDGNKLWIRRYE